MDIKDIKKRIDDNVAKLNEMDCGLVFSFQEEKDVLSLINHGKNNEHCSYGVFSFMIFFEAYTSKYEAYMAAMTNIELLVAGTKLLDHKSYHYVKEVA